MIVSIPENKKIQKYSPLNESFFTDIDDESQDYSEELSNNIKLMALQPVIEKTLEALDVHNFDIVVIDNYTIGVNVHGHLFLPNCNLALKYNPKLFKFNVIDGDCNFSGNNLTDWSRFPNFIKGNCIANFNKLKSFDGAPDVLGEMYALKQRTKTKYPLNSVNYKKYINGELSENRVYIISANKYGNLLNINESKNNAAVKLENGLMGVYKLDDIVCLSNIDKLLSL